MQCRHLPCVTILLIASLASTRCFVNDNGGRAFFNLFAPLIGGILNAETLESVRAPGQARRHLISFAFKQRLGIRDIVYPR
jgi:hypothetical protein